MTAPSSTEWHDNVLLDVALLDPRVLQPHPRNVREDLVDLDGLTASIAAQGVIEPLSVIQLEDSSYMLVTGHRRAAAAIAAGVDQVPCVIRRDLSVDAVSDLVQAEHVGTMLAENLQRSGLTVVEEAHGVQTMLDLGLDLAAVSARTGLDRTRVAKAAGVARLAPGAAAAVAVAGLTLDQAAVVARFEDSADVVEDLVEAAGQGPGRFAHAVTRAEQERATADRLAERRAELVEAGRQVLVEGQAREEGHMRLSGLLHDGELVTSESHADCPGSAVLLEGSRGWDGEPNIADVEVCTDPAGNGHTYRWVRTPDVPGQSMADEELERQRAERSEVLAKNRAMDAANATRRAWVREYLARRTAPKTALRFAVEAIATYPDELHSWLSGIGTREGTAAALDMGLHRPSRFVATEVSLTSGEHVVDGRLPLQLLGHVAAAIEAATPRDAWRSTGHDRDRLVAWLTFLTSEGYTLADIEAEVIAP
jgi:ParB family chromosome partitioning protein